MKKIILKTIAILSIGAAFFAFCFGGSTVFAQTTRLGKIVHGENTQWNWFTKGFGVNSYGDVVPPGELAQRITAIIFGVLGIIAVVMVIYAGFLWLTAGGEEDKTKKATTLLFQSAIGLAVILAAYSLTYFVIYQLTLAIGTAR